MVLLAALSYQRNLREQTIADYDVFDQAKKRAYEIKFIEHDVIDNTDTESSGGIVSYSLNVDRQANRLFQGGQRRTTGSSASVYYSNAEDPPNEDYTYYNNTDIGPEAPGNAALKKKIYEVRTNGIISGTEDPVDGIRLKTLDYIAILYPALSTIAQGVFNLKEVTWWQQWGGYIDIALRAISFGYLTYHYIKATNDLEQSEAERAGLKARDEEMGEWGWRICDLNHDGSERAGKFYVKEVIAQVYDMETEENKNINYNETQQVNSSTRSVGVGHVVNRKILRRFDTSINPTLPLASHTFETLGEEGVTLDLSGGQSETWN